MRDSLYAHMSITIPNFGEKEKIQTNEGDSFRYVRKNVHHALLHGFYPLPDSNSDEKYHCFYLIKKSTTHAVTFVITTRLSRGPNHPTEPTRLCLLSGTFCKWPDGIALCFWGFRFGVRLASRPSTLVCRRFFGVVFRPRRF